MLDSILSSQNELVDNVKIHKPFGSSDHNQIHFNIKEKTGNVFKKQWRRNFHKGKYKGMRTYLANKNKGKVQEKHLSKEAITKIALK